MQRCSGQQSEEERHTGNEVEPQTQWTRAELEFLASKKQRGVEWNTAPDWEHTDPVGLSLVSIRWFDLIMPVCVLETYFVVEHSFIFLLLFLILEIA